MKCCSPSLDWYNFQSWETFSSAPMHLYNGVLKCNISSFTVLIDDVIAYRFTGWFLHHLLGRLYSTILVHKGQIDMIKDATKVSLLAVTSHSTICDQHSSNGFSISHLPTSHILSTMYYLFTCLYILWNIK